MNPERDQKSANGRPLSALPSVQARALAFAAILVAGVCGALIGYGFVGLQCTGNCSTPEGAGAVVGGALAAAGVAVVAVLTLRAMGEWRTIKEERALAEVAGQAERAEGAERADAIEAAEGRRITPKSGEGDPPA
jgi:hypothetical protein